MAPGRLIASAVALAAAMVGLAVLLTGGDPKPPPVGVNATPAADRVHTPLKHMHAQRPAPPPAADPAPAPAPAAPAPTLGAYTATYYTVDRPVDWTTEHDDEQQSGGLLRSQWRDPANSSTSILIDSQEESASAEEKANEVRAETSKTPGYQEIAFTSTTMNGVSAMRWEFSVSGTHRIDYFVHDESCGVGVAVLGTASPGNFEGLRETFSKVADSVSIDCSSASTPAPSSQPKCDPNYKGACLDPNSPDYDCVGGSGDGPDYTGEVRVVGNDHFQLDRDGDGVACEP